MLTTMLRARAVSRLARSLSTTTASATTTATTTAEHEGPAASIERLAVVGAGLMGAGIAQVAAQAGLRVVLVDESESALSKARDLIAASAPRVGKRVSPADVPGFVARINANITTTTDAASAVGDADVVLEAIVEHLSAKRSLFARLDALAPRDTIFASNTSGLLISDIAAAVSPQRRARFGGLHFFNPVPVMRLVEVPRPAELDEGVFRKLFELAQRLGKTPVSCADTPGFIVNRLNVPYKLEVVRMLERGDATPEDIDTAMRLGAGYPMGPLELFDLTGVDTTHYLTLGWKEYAARGLLPEELVRPTKMMADMVERGELGRKTGRGFYSYTSGKKESRS